MMLGIITDKELYPLSTIDINNQPEYDSTTLK